MSIATSVRENSPRNNPTSFSSQTGPYFMNPGFDGADYSQVELGLPSKLNPDPVLSEHLRLNSEAVHAQSELTVQGVLNLLPIGVLTLNHKGLVIQANPASESLLGSELMGQYWRDIIAANFDPKEDDGHEVSLISGRRVSLMTRSVDEDSGQLIVISDLSETRELQTKLSRHQRLSSMGQMMSSLAHQIRTPLAAALLHAGNLQSAMEHDPQVSNSTQKIMSRLNHIERQIKDMLIFSRGGVTPTDCVDIATLHSVFIEAADDLALSYEQSIVWELGNTDGFVKANLDALLGAFLNLLENAFQASSAASAVTVKLDSQPSDSDRHRSCFSIQVIDQGTGVDEELFNAGDQEIISTKSNGNGLGLAIVKLVSKSHGGSFRFHSRKEGAHAEISLPMDKLKGELL